MPLPEKISNTYLIQELDAFQKMRETLNNIKKATYRILDCGNGYWFFGYVDVSSLGQDTISVKTEFTDSLYKAVNSIDPSVFPTPSALTKFFEYRSEYTKFAESYLTCSAPDLNSHNFKQEPDSEKAFETFLQQSKINVNGADFKLD